MAAIRIVDFVNLVKSERGGSASAAARERFGEGELTSERFDYFPEPSVEMQLFTVRLRPDVEIRPHAHSEDEAIYVTEGSLALGARTVGVAGAVFIPARTLYGFRAGPDGCVFLNFRPAARADYISREELLEQRSS